MALFPFRQRMIRCARFLARADLFSFALLWLMVLLVAGTVSQKEVGLYQAQETYFSSFFLWLWDLAPLPGMLTVIIFIFMGLACRLALDTWEWRNAGIIVTHLGAMFLLFGGFLTAQFSIEGTMIIPEGATRHYMEDARHVELALPRAEGGETVFAQDRLRPGAILAGPDMPFTLEILSYCRNCALQRLPRAREEGNPHGVAINFDLKSIPRDPVDEKNRAGITFTIHGTDSADGLYTVFEDMPILQTVTTGGKTTLIAMRRVRTDLPFSVTLDDFERRLYPGTGDAKAYQSAVTVNDGAVRWPALIRMNEPLRYKGYTFYQSSFLEGSTETVSVLAVVKNIGRTFPYISGGLICLGILLQMAQRYFRKGTT